MKVLKVPTAWKQEIAQGDVRLFWWAFALRGGFAIAFAGVLRFAASLLGTVFFDPVLLVSISLLLGSYVFGNGVLLGVGGVFARQHHMRHWTLLIGESVFAMGLAGFIAFSLLMTSESLAWLAALHCLGIGIFQIATAWRLREVPSLVVPLSASAAWSLAATAFFLLNRHEGVETMTLWLSWFELLFGIIAVGVAVGLHGREAARKHVTALPERA